MNLSRARKKTNKQVLCSLGVLVCLALLSGCVFTQPGVTASPNITVTSNNSPTSPESTLVHTATLPPTKTTPLASPADPTQATTAQPSPTQHPQATSTDLPRATHTPSAPIPPLPEQVPAQYNLEAIFDYYQHSLSVSETIHYVNQAGEELPDLILVVEPNLVPGSFSLNSISWEDGKPIETYELNENQLHIPLPQPLQPGDTLALALNYDLYIPEIGTSYNLQGSVAYGYSARQTNLVDWYPYVPPYQGGQGWLVHPTWWFGEYQVFDVADFSVTITLAEPVADLAIAASAPATQEGDRYTYHLQAARTFALSASTEYRVESKTVGDVTVISYSFPYDKYSGQEVLTNTADAVGLYSQLITPYSRSTLSVVEADFLDGMEYDGLFFLSYGFYDLYDGTPKGYLTFIAAHETAHQWWYGLVGNDQALEPWLDEALCTYMEHVFYENIYPDNPPQSGGNLVDWWWYYRVNFYDPQGLIGGSIYDFPDFFAYRDAVYLNGAKFLQDLRNLIGDEAFFGSLRAYAAQNAYRIATAQDFFNIVREHTDQDLEGLIASYFQANP